MPTAGDIMFGRIAVENRYVKKESVVECLKLQKELEKKKMITTLERVLLEKNFLTVSQVEGVQAEQNRKVYFCKNCNAKYNISSFKGGEQFTCTRCNEKMEIPSLDSYHKFLTNIWKGEASVLKYLDMDVEYDESSAETAIEDIDDFEDEIEKEDLQPKTEKIDLRKLRRRRGRRRRR